MTPGMEKSASAFDVKIEPVQEETRDGLYPYDSASEIFGHGKSDKRNSM